MNGGWRGGQGIFRNRLHHPLPPTAHASPGHLQTYFSPSRPYLILLAPASASCFLLLLPSLLSISRQPNHPSLPSPPLLASLCLPLFIINLIFVSFLRF
jgi:hypothetical protein